MSIYNSFKPSPIHIHKQYGVVQFGDLPEFKNPKTHFLKFLNFKSHNFTANHVYFKNKVSLTFICFNVILICRIRICQDFIDSKSHAYNLELAYNFIYYGLIISLDTVCSFLVSEVVFKD